MNPQPLRLACLAVSIAAFAACTNDIPYDPSDEQKEGFTKNFITQFGRISPEQDWNTATRVKADITLGERYSASAKNLRIEVYTSRPGNAASVKMASVPASKSSFDFDFVKSLDYAFVALVDLNGTQMWSDYVPIEKGAITLNLSQKISRAADTPTRNEIPASRRGSSIHVEDTHVTAQDQYGLYYIDGAYQGASSIWTVADFYELTYEGKPFHEQLGSNDMCNLRKYFENDLGQIQSDVEYVIGNSPSEVSIDFFYANTSKSNALGYIYFPEGATQEQIMKANHYMVIDEATPAHLTFDGSQATSASIEQAYNVIKYNSFAAESTLSKQMYGERYKLVYFDEHGNASYEFPPRTHIVFFIAINEAGKFNSSSTDNVQESNFKYSVNWMNNKFNKREYYTGCCTTCYDKKAQHPEDFFANFVTYSWYGKLLFGIEDEGSDDDMNDLMFSIDGDFDFQAFSTPILVFGDNPVPEVGWIVAAEDLGGKADFDFNDVVFGVDYDSDTRKIKVTPLAAGGTLPLYICYNGQPIGKEIHEWFGVGTSVMYNTKVFNGAASTIEIDYTGIGDFTMSNTVNNGNMGGFSIMIDGSSVITAPGKGDAPQMICMPPGWLWPQEGTRINIAYEGFSEWGMTPALNWYSTPSSSRLVVSWR